MPKTAYYEIPGGDRFIDDMQGEISAGMKEICQKGLVLEIEYTDAYVIRLNCCRNRTLSESKEQERSALSDLAYSQILEYLEGKRRIFDFPYQMIGTEFQKRVWQKLCEIPYGETRTYKEIAEALGKPSAGRAVGMACSKNPIWIAVPCHRVIGAGGSLTGYAGGLDMKKALLQLEQGGYFL